MSPGTPSDATGGRSIRVMSHGPVSGVRRAAPATIHHLARLRHRDPIGVVDLELDQDLLRDLGRQLVAQGLERLSASAARASCPEAAAAAEGLISMRRCGAGSGAPGSDRRRRRPRHPAPAPAR